MSYLKIIYLLDLIMMIFLAIIESLNGEDAMKQKETLDPKHDSLIENNIWILKDFSSQCFIISCKWILKRKCNIN